MKILHPTIILTKAFYYKLFPQLIFGITQITVFHLLTRLDFAEKIVLVLS